MKPFILSLFFAATLSGTKYKSQACQDQFVEHVLYTLSHKNDEGYYLEIGAGQPININNSYYFEKQYQWKGISIDWSDFKNQWHTYRSNTFICQDALTCDYSKILSTFPKVIDYLSLDIDGSYDQVLLKLPLDQYIFKVITIEHDAYRFGSTYRDNERAILSSYGYYLLCPDVSIKGNVFEDWWIHPSTFTPEILQSLSSLNLTHMDNVKILQTLRQNMGN